MNKKVFINVLAIIFAVTLIWLATEQGDTKTLTQDQEGYDSRATKLDSITPYEGSGAFSLTRNSITGIFSYAFILNIDDPAPGKFYEGWLVVEEPELKFVSGGKFEKKREGRYSLGSTQYHDYPSFNDVLVTEETEALGLDGIPETHVLEGSLPEPEE